MECYLFEHCYENKPFEWFCDEWSATFTKHPGEPVLPPAEETKRIKKLCQEISTRRFKEQRERCSRTEVAANMRIAKMHLHEIIEELIGRVAHGKIPLPGHSHSTQ